jgi:excisionase family DNA binding protein
MSAPTITSPASERLLTMKEVAARLQISAVTAWRLTAERGLRKISIGRCVRVRETDLQGWLERHTSGGDGNGQAAEGSVSV